MSQGMSYQREGGGRRSRAKIIRQNMGRRWDGKNEQEKRAYFSPLHERM